MQLEETASSKDVPPLSTRGVLELPEFVAQHKMLQISLVSIFTRLLMSSQTKSLVD